MPSSSTDFVGSLPVLFSQTSPYAPPDANQFLADLRAEFLPEILLFFSAMAGLYLVFWLVRAVARNA